MVGQGKQKRKALHRGLDSVFNRDANLTSRLLGRVKQPDLDPVESPSDEEGDSNDTARRQDGASRLRSAARKSSSASASPLPSISASPQETKTSGVERLDSHRRGARTDRLENSQAVIPNKRTSLHPAPSPQRAVVLEPGLHSFEEFAKKHSRYLVSGERRGKLKICEVIFNNTYAIGQETFISSYPKIAKLAGIQKKQCQNNIKQLEADGFVERVNIFNTATQQGTEFKLHLVRLNPDEIHIPRTYHYTEDLPKADDFPN